MTTSGTRPRRNRQQVLKRVGFVPQLPPPLQMSVNELVLFAAHVSDSDPKLMEDLAVSLGLDFEAVRHQPFVKLSGGQKQKLLIGIALGRNCDMLFMDEPAANLDPESRQVFFKLLAEHNHKSVMLMSSHRLDEVAAFVNRVVELDQGRVTLDDHVVDTVELTSLLTCTIEASRNEEALAKALTEWGFEKEGEAPRWQGTVAGPDRLRFLSMVSRYAGLLVSLDLQGGNGA